jgi:hypothetical protein
LTNVAYYLLNLRTTAQLTLTSSNANLTSFTKTGSGSVPTRFRYELTDWRRNVLLSDASGSISQQVALLPVSYGIQPCAFEAGAFETTILLLDWPLPMVQTDDVNWTSNCVAAARHNGRINVLHRNGHVSALTPAEIQPTNTNLQLPIRIWINNNSWIPRTNNAYWGWHRMCM